MVSDPTNSQALFEIRGKVTALIDRPRHRSIKR